MLLPHDVFNDIIKFSDMKTLLKLYGTNHTIHQLVLNHPFSKVLLKFKTNPYFNLDATSTLLNDFLNDLVGNDIEMLKRLQTSFGACLIGKNISKQIIVLDGICNGKYTFRRLLQRLLGDLYVAGYLTANGNECKYYNDAYMVHFFDTSTWHTFNFKEKLKFLSDEPKFTTMITTDINNIQDLNDVPYTKRLNIFKFKSIYVDQPHNINEKLRIPAMLRQLDHPSILSALLNFLLQGCREVLDH